MREEDRRLYYGDFEAEGEDQVRANLALGRYQAKKGLAEQWLAQREKDRASGAADEQLMIARSAKDAAWESARSAAGANTIAKWALGVAAVSALIALVALTGWRP